MKKRCTECYELKPLDKFPLGGYKKDNRRIRWGICKKCVKLKKPIPPAEKRAYIKENPRPAAKNLDWDQKFTCPVCLRYSWPQSNRQIVLDHDHTTGAIRGWVCVKCNVGIGRLREDPDILKRAIDWIKHKR